MSPREIAALFWRHIMAVAVVFISTAGLAYHLQHASPGYVDTATVAFNAPGNGVAVFNGTASLLVVDALTARSVMSAHGQQQVRNAGGTSSYDVALINLNNEDYPDYGVPYVTVTATSPSAPAAEQTFSAVMQVMQQDLVTLQRSEGAKPKAYIGLQTIAAPSGPVAQTGLRKRALAWPSWPSSWRT